MKSLKLDLIVTTAGTQIRASINADAVDEYAEAMRDAGNNFPPVVVFHDGSEYILADGFHRVMAASRNGFKDINADIRKGGKADALKYALGANSTHGIPRTNRDKRRSVELALEQWPKLSDVEVGKICAVGKTLVGEVRRDIQPVEKTGCEKRIGADGKERKMPTRKSERQVTHFEESETPTISIDAKWKSAAGNPEAVIPNAKLEAFKEFWSRCDDEDRKAILAHLTKEAA